MPFFSVVIPCYNKANVIYVTINSVLEQSFDDFEVIIIDDGSTDNSVKVIQSFNDNRIKLIQQNNAGVSIARNLGIKEATGEWIAFLDADDWWHPNYLTTLEKVIKENKNTEFIGTQFYAQATKENWQPTPWSFNLNQVSIQKISNLPQEWMQRIPFFTSSTCIKKSLLLQQTELFKAGQKQGEDLDLWFRLAEQVNILNIKSPLVVYRTEQTSSLSQQASHIEEHYHIKTMNERLQNHKIPTQLISSSKKFIAQDKLTRARLNILENNRTAALKLIFSACFVISTKRWWMSLFMTLFTSKQFLKNWMLKNSGRQELSN